MAGIIVAIAAVLHFAQLHVGDIGITLHDGIRTETADDEWDGNDRPTIDLQTPSTI